MTEQDLLNYESSQCEKNELQDDFFELKSKYASYGTVDYARIGRPGTVNDYNDRLIKIVEQMEQVSNARSKAQAEFDKSLDCYHKALAVCTTTEKDYLYKRYIACMTNKEIAKAICLPIRDVYYLRKSILEKIKDL